MIEGTSLVKVGGYKNCLKLLKSSKTGLGTAKGTQLCREIWRTHPASAPIPVSEISAHMLRGKVMIFCRGARVAKGLPLELKIPVLSNT